MCLPSTHYPRSHLPVPGGRYRRVTLSSEKSSVKIALPVCSGHADHVASGTTRQSFPFQPWIAFITSRLGGSGAPSISRFGRFGCFSEAPRRASNLSQKMAPRWVQGGAREEKRGKRQVRREGVKSGKDTLYKRKNIFLLYISYPYPFHASVEIFPKTTGKDSGKIGKDSGREPLSLAHGLGKD